MQGSPCLQKPRPAHVARAGPGPSASSLAAPPPAGLLPERAEHLPQHKALARAACPDEDDGGVLAVLHRGCEDAVQLSVLLTEPEERVRHRAPAVEGGRVLVLAQSQPRACARTVNCPTVNLLRNVACSENVTRFSSCKVVPGNLCSSYLI